MKHHNFLLIYKRFIRKEENSQTVVNEKRKNKKNCALFYLTGYFMKPLIMALKHFFLNRSFYSQDFFILQAFSQRNFCFLMSG